MVEWQVCFGNVGYGGADCEERRGFGEGFTESANCLVMSLRMSIFISLSHWILHAVTATSSSLSNILRLNASVSFLNLKIWYDYYSLASSLAIYIFTLCPDRKVRVEPSIWASTTGHERGSCLPNPGPCLSIPNHTSYESLPAASTSPYRQNCKGELMLSFR